MPALHGAAPITKGRPVSNMTKGLLLVVGFLALCAAKGDSEDHRHDQDVRHHGHDDHERDHDDDDRQESKKGGCRSKGRHPHGKHGSKGHRDGHDDDEYEHYLKNELMKKEDEWDAKGVEGPTSAEAAKLMADCLVAADTDDVKAEECESRVPLPTFEPGPCLCLRAHPAADPRDGTFCVAPCR